MRHATMKAARTFPAFFLLIASLLGAGCVDTTTSLTVKEDGSGTIGIKVLISEDAIKQSAMSAGNAMGNMMADAMAGMAGGMAQALGAPPQTNLAAEMKSAMATGMMDTSKMTMSRSAPVYNELQAKNLAKSFGSGVRFLDGHAITNGTREGFVARYAFNDIDKVRLSAALGDDVMSGTEGQGQQTAQKPTEFLSFFTFKLKKGNPAVLSITQPEQPPEDHASGTGEVQHNATNATSGAEEAGNMVMAPQMKEQMLQAFKGKKDKVVLTVDGTVIETNSRFRSQKRPDSMVLLAVDFDAILADPEGKKALGAENPNPMATLRKLKIPGLCMEEPGKVITVSFK